MRLKATVREGGPAVGRNLRGEYISERRRKRWRGGAFYGAFCKREDSSEGVMKLGM